MSMKKEESVDSTNDRLERRRGLVLYTSWRAVAIIVAIITSATVIVLFYGMDFSDTNQYDTNKDGDTNIYIDNSTENKYYFNDFYVVLLFIREGYSSEGDYKSYSFNFTIYDMLFGSYMYIVGSSVIFQNLYLMNETEYDNFENSLPFTYYCAQLHRQQGAFNILINSTNTYYLVFQNNETTASGGLEAYIFSMYKYT